MILLHRLRCRSFKQLSDVDLELPDQGTVLIEGPNEAGKSSLFEAIYFALYGRALIADRDYKIADLKSYGAEEMVVELDFSVEGRPFHVARRVGRNQTALLRAASLEGEAVETRGVEAVNRRIREELRLSPDALLNTCFVEQKRLERLEALDPAERRATINELLNLRVLTQMAERLRVTPEDRAALQAQKERVELARLDHALPELERAEAEAGRCLTYARLLEAAAGWEELEERLADARSRETRLEARRREIAGLLGRCEELKVHLRALESDLPLRVRAWGDALAVRDRAREAAEELGTLAEGLERRREDLRRLEALHRELSALEGLAAEAGRLESDLERLRAVRERLAKLRDVCREAEEERKRLGAEVEERAGAVREAQAALNRYRLERARTGEYRLLLSHAERHQALSREAQALECRAASAREAVEALPALEARLVRLEEAEPHLRQMDERQERLGEAAVELVEASQAADAQGERLRAARQRQEDAAARVRGLGRRAVVCWSMALLGILALAAGLALGLTVLSGAGGAAALMAGVMGARSQSALAAGRREESRLAEDLAVQQGQHQFLESRLKEVAGRHERLREDLRTAEALCRELEGLGVAPGLDGLRASATAVRQAIASGRAAAEALAELERQHAEKAAQAREALEQAQAVARELGLAGDRPEEWRIHLPAPGEDRSEEDTLARRVSEAEELLDEARQRVGALEALQEQRRRDLAEGEAAAPEAALEDLGRAVDANRGAREALARVPAALRAEGFPTQTAELGARLAVLRSGLEADEARAEALPQAEDEAARCAGRALREAESFAAAWRAHRPEEAPPAAPEEALSRLPEARSTLTQRLEALNEAGLRQEDVALVEEQVALGKQMHLWADRQQELKEAQRAYRRDLGLEDGSSEPPPARWPELAAVRAGDVAAWEQTLADRGKAVQANRIARADRAALLGLGEEPLDLEREEQALAGVQRELEVKRRASEIVARTRETLVSRVMPLTLQNTRQLLPLLTEGRYQDVEWDEATNTLTVYDGRARCFQRKRVFSGGARDQISLALRLAFALATLPGEHNVQPGWLLLDEPLSSFDRRRTQALVELLTRGVIRRQFRQVFLVSHSESFDPDCFDHRLRLEGGRVAESTLPSAGAR